MLSRQDSMRATMQQLCPPPQRSEMSDGLLSSPPNSTYPKKTSRKRRRATNKKARQLGDTISQRAAVAATLPQPTQSSAAATAARSSSHARSQRAKHIKKHQKNSAPSFGGKKTKQAAKFSGRTFRGVNPPQTRPKTPISAMGQTCHSRSSETTKCTVAKCPRGTKCNGYRPCRRQATCHVHFSMEHVLCSNMSKKFNLSDNYTRN